MFRSMDRYLEFTEKFNRRLERELSNSILLVSSESFDDIIARIKKEKDDLKPSERKPLITAQNVAAKPPERPGGQSSFTSRDAGTGKDKADISNPSFKKGQTQGSSEGQRSQRPAQQKPLAENATPATQKGRLEVIHLMSAHIIMEEFYKKVFEMHDRPFKSPQQIRALQAELANQYKVQLEVVKMQLKQAAPGVLNLFECAHYFKFEQVSSEAMRHNYTNRTVTKMFKERFGHSHEKLDVTSLDTCLSREDVESQFLFEDPAEMLVIRSFGDESEEKYQKLKRDKAEEMYRGVVYLQEYKRNMSRVMDKEVCVDVEDFERAEAQELAALKTPPGPLRMKTESLVQELKKPFLDQVRLNHKSEEACVSKAIEYACDHYNKVLLNNMDECNVLEFLHSVVYVKIRRCFKTVPDFEYSRLWKWPSEEPQKIKQYFHRAREQRRLEIEMKDKATNCFKQLTPKQRSLFLQENFPEHLKPKQETNPPGSTPIAIDKPVSSSFEGPIQNQSQNSSINCERFFSGKRSDTFGRSSGSDSQEPEPKRPKVAPNLGIPATPSAPSTGCLNKSHLSASASGATSARASINSSLSATAPSGASSFSSSPATLLPRSAPAGKSLSSIQPPISSRHTILITAPPRFQEPHRNHQESRKTLPLSSTGRRGLHRVFRPNH